MEVRILRQDGPEGTPYVQSFEYTLKAPEPVAYILENLNASEVLLDREGKPARKIRWDCSCLEKKCGACAMVINGTPALACDYVVFPETEVLKLEPLKKFPCISDLTVDRTIIAKQMSEVKMYFEEGQKTKRSFEEASELSKCIKCGLCMEVCPNYKNGIRFFGPQMANEAALVYGKNRRDKTARKEDRKNAIAHFGNGCSGSFACEKVCPVKIRTLSSIADLYRLI